MEKRFGRAAFPFSPVTSGQGLGQGIFKFPFSSSTSGLICVTNNNVYLQTSNSAFTSIGTIVTSTRALGVLAEMVRFQYVPGSSTYVILSSGNNNGFGTAGTYGIKSTVLNGNVVYTLTTISGNNGYPGGTVPGFALLDGTTYVMDLNSNIWGSTNLNDPTIWTDALNVIQADSEGDIPIALAKQLVYVIAFKSTSIEMFFDNGNPTGSPLSPVPGALIKHGCLDANTIQDIDGILFWVSSDKNSAACVAMMENLQYAQISTPAVDRFLSLTEGYTVSQYTFRSYSFRAAGHRFYGVTNVSSGVSLVYDIDQKLWYQWTDPYGNFYPVVSVTTDLSNNLIAQLYSPGIVNYIGPDYQYLNDNGVLFPMDIYTPNFDAGVDREKTLSAMHLFVRFSDDDYQSWNNFRLVNLNNKHPMLNDEGSFYRRAYHFRHYANTPFRIRAVGLEMDVGTM